MDPIGAQFSFAASNRNCTDSTSKSFSGLKNSTKKKTENEFNRELRFLITKMTEMTEIDRNDKNGRNDRN